MDVNRRLMGLDASHSGTLPLSCCFWTPYPSHDSWCRRCFTHLLYHYAASEHLIPVNTRHKRWFMVQEMLHTPSQACRWTPNPSQHMTQERWFMVQEMLQKASLSWHFWTDNLSEYTTHVTLHDTGDASHIGIVYETTEIRKIVILGVSEHFRATW